MKNPQISMPIRFGAAPRFGPAPHLPSSPPRQNPEPRLSCPPRPASPGPPLLSGHVVRLTYLLYVRSPCTTFALIALDDPSKIAPGDILRGANGSQGDGRGVQFSHLEGGRRMAVKLRWGLDIFRFRMLQGELLPGGTRFAAA